MNVQILSRLCRRISLPVSALAVALTVAFCASRCLPTRQETGQVFDELSPQVQSELLAGAVALMTGADEGYTVRLAVAGVLLNRLESGRYGDSLWLVTAPLLSEYPASEGIPARYDEGAMTAATDALSGLRPLPDAMCCGRGEREGAVKIGEWWFAQEE